MDQDQAPRENIPLKDSDQCEMTSSTPEPEKTISVGLTNEVGPSTRLDKHDSGDAETTSSPYTVHVAIEPPEESTSDVVPGRRRRTMPSRYRDYRNVDELGEEDMMDDDEYKPFRSPSIRGKVRARKYMKLDDNVKSEEMQNDEENTNPGREGDKQMDISCLTQPAKRRGRATKFKDFSKEELEVKRNFRCSNEACGQTFVHMGGLLRHKRVQHPEDGSIPPKPGSVMERNFTCPTCEKSFTSACNLRHHIKLHSGERNFRCDMCDKSFLIIESLKRHKMSHLGIKPFECDVCEQRFASNVALKEHKSRHSDSKPYQCEACGRKFRQVSVYKRHLTTHTSDQPYECLICHRRFSQTTYLRSHMKKHTGERPFKCDLCDKRFAHLSDKTRHQKTHSGEKPYACEMCGARFTDHSSCRRHVKEHSTTQPFTCDYCGFSFKRKVSLRTHMVRSHQLRMLSPKLEGKQSENMHLRILGDSRIVLLAPNGQEISTLTEVLDSSGQKILKAKNDVVQGIINPQQTVDQTILLKTEDVIAAEEVMLSTASIANSSGQAEGLSEAATQQIIQQIESQLGTQEGGIEGQQLQVAYHVLHDDENQQIVEIQYEAYDQEVSTPAIIQEVSVPGNRDPSGDIVSGAEIIASYENQSVGEEQTLLIDTQDDSYSDSAPMSVLNKTDQGVISPVQQPISEKSAEKEQHTQIITPDEQILIDYTAEKTDNSNAGLNDDKESENKPVLDSSIQSSSESAEVLSPSGSQNSVEIFPTSDISRINDTVENAQIHQETVSAKSAASHVTEPQSSEPRLEDSGFENSDPPHFNILESDLTRTFIAYPDFTSQDYYNWLSSFTDQCKQACVPLSVSVFKSISQVHKTLSDIMATPKGILAHKENFRILMSISQDLSGIISKHLHCVLAALEQQS